MEARLEQLGFSGEHVRAATRELDAASSLDAVCQTLLSSHPSGPQALARELLVPPGVGKASGGGTSEAAVGLGARPASERAAAAAPVAALQRGLSRQSQQVLERVTSRHTGISHAAIVRLLLRAAAALRQGLLTPTQRTQLHQHLEQGDIDLVHSVVLGVGARSEPGMPLEDGEARWECCICFTEQEEHGWSCPSDHRYCSQCMRQHVASVPFPRCPASDCKYELEEKDFHLLHIPQDRVDVFRDAKLRTAVDTLAGAASSSSSGNAVRVARADMAEVVLRCPNADCGNAMLVPQNQRRRYVCACGTTPFCTRCRQVPYHYHADCAEVQPLRQRWLDWVSGGRDDFFGRARASATYETQALVLREGLERHRELEADEQWKAKKCRTCPNCQRPVQKLQGCDAMVCGSDAHGGNTQPGCGHSFSWQAAPRYEVKVESRELPKIKTEEIRCRGHGTLHAFIDCSLCGSGGRGILGPRFRCLHCEAFDVCKDCEPRLAAAHDPSHVFEVMLESDFGWGGIRLPKGTRVRAVRSGCATPVNLEDTSAKRCLEGVCGIVISAPPSSSSRKRKREATPKRYEWQSDRGRWYAYDAAANATIILALRQGRMRARVHVGGSRYTLDLASMRQRNMATGGERAIRAVEEPEAAAAAVAEAAAAAHMEAATASANPYRVRLDEGGEVVLTGAHLEPILDSRAEAEKLLEQALKEQEEGVPEELPAPVEEEEEEGDEDGEEEYEEDE